MYLHQARHTTRPDRGTLRNSGFLLRDEPLQTCVPVQLAEAAPGGDSRRASTPRHGAPAADARARKALSACQSSATASDAEQPFGHLAQDAPARVASSARKSVQFQHRGGVGPRQAATMQDAGGGGQGVPVRPRSACDSVRKRGAGPDGMGRARPCRQARQCEAWSAPGQRPATSTRRRPSWVSCVAAGTRQNAKAYIGRWVGIRKKLHHGIVIGNQADARHAHPGRIFQQAQAPTPAPHPTTTAQPVAAVVGVSAQYSQASA